jgi:polysaccharide export outer membrane protein
MKKSVALLILFLSATCLSVRADDIPTVGTPYTLRPGDEFLLAYRITPEFNQDVTLGPDGHANLYIVGDVQLSGLTLQQAHDLIIQKEASRLNDPELSIVMKDFDKPFVVVSGEVVLPGRILVRRELTALQAVMLAGGFKETAKDTQVLVYRRLGAGDLAEVHEINLHRIRKKAQLQNDLLLQPGDMLMIPVNKVEHVQRYVRLNPFGFSYNLAAI